MGLVVLLDQWRVANNQRRPQGQLGVANARGLLGPDRVIADQGVLGGLAC